MATSPRAFGLGPLETIVAVQFASSTSIGLLTVVCTRFWTEEQESEPPFYAVITDSNIDGLAGTDLLQEFTPVRTPGLLPSSPATADLLWGLGIDEDFDVEVSVEELEIIDRATHIVATVFGDITVYIRPGPIPVQIVPIQIDYTIDPFGSSGTYVGSGTADAIAREASLAVFGDEDNAQPKFPPESIDASHTDTIVSTNHTDHVEQTIVLNMAAILADLPPNETIATMTIEVGGPPLGFEPEFSQNVAVAMYSGAKRIARTGSGGTDYQVQNSQGAPATLTGSVGANSPDAGMKRVMSIAIENGIITILSDELQPQ